MKTLNTLKIVLKKYYPTFLTLATAFLAAAYLYSLHGNPLAVFSTSSEIAQIETDTPTEEDFKNYLQELFLSEVTSNTLNLHYTLSNPKSRDITEYPVTFGDITAEGEAAKLAALENIQTELEKYKNISFSSKDLQVTYDVLEDDINMQLSAAPYFYYEELLSSTNGIQVEYPILLAEYRFQSEQDIKDYLKLLEQYDSFFEQLCRFEQKKAKQGLFMSETSAQNLLKQCRAFLPDNSADSFWETTFLERLENVEGLTEKQKKKYVKQNHKLLKEHVYPAYRHLIAVIKALQHSGKNNQGLCYYKNGKEYYELLVKSTTGSGRSISELKEMIQERRKVCLLALKRIPTLQSASSEVLSKTPEEMVEYLKKQIEEDFPALPETDYTIKNVSKNLEDFLSPAFYLTSPMDDYKTNCIYINPSSSNYEGIDLFTTLAHEGFPGHLFQTVYSYTRELPDIRHLLYHGGYIEGWATYVEMRAYMKADLDKNLAKALALNQEAILSLYATTDIGIHYDGWSLADTVHFLSGYGITDAAAISNMYQTIIENPSNYLKYYIGYLEILNLKAQAKESYGQEFSEKNFHTAILDIGTAPFYIIEKYFYKYYEAAN